jgi:hypothetical protein
MRRNVLKVAVDGKALAMRSLIGDSGSGDGTPGMPLGPR